MKYNCFLGYWLRATEGPRLMASIVNAKSTKNLQLSTKVPNFSSTINDNGGSGMIKSSSFKTENYKITDLFTPTPKALKIPEATVATIE